MDPEDKATLQQVKNNHGKISLAPRSMSPRPAALALSIYLIPKDSHSTNVTSNYLAEKWLVNDCMYIIMYHFLLVMIVSMLLKYDLKKKLW